MQFLFKRLLWKKIGSWEQGASEAYSKCFHLNKFLPRLLYINKIKAPFYNGAYFCSGGLIKLHFSSSKKVFQVSEESFLLLALHSSQSTTTRCFENRDFFCLHESLQWSQLSNYLSHEKDQTNGTGPSSREAGTLLWLFPTSKVYCFVWKGGKTFCLPAVQVGRFPKAVPAGPGRGAQRAPFFPVQNVFLNEVFRCAALALPSSVPRRVLCTSPTQAQADLARRPAIYLIWRTSLQSGQLILILLSACWRALTQHRQPIHSSSDFGSS